MSMLGYLLVVTAVLCCTVQSEEPCKQPERMSEAELQGEWDEETYPHNTRAMFVCRPGYSRLGAIRMICTNGKWEFMNPVGKCKRKSCGHPGDIDFGTFELIKGTEFVFGAIVQYKCDEGYQMLSKQKTRECTANGWTFVTPHCEVKKCGPIEVPVGVNLISTSYDEEYTVGQVVRFECQNTKFGVHGAKEIFCKSEGEWSADPPVCKEISCEEPNISNGIVKFSKKSYQEDEKISYECNKSFRPERSSDTVCTEHGWSPSPSCIEIVCYPEYVENGKINEKQNVYREGEIIALECNRGYQIERNPEQPRKCTKNGWSLPLTCISKMCDRPNLRNGAPYEGYWHGYFPRRMNAFMEYYCHDGYRTLQKVLNGKAQCKESGWQPTPTCYKTCSNAYAKVENARLSGTQNIYLNGEKVTFQCYNGFTTEDGKDFGEIECLPNGEFSHVRCRRVCRTELLVHGRYNPNKNIFEVGEYVKYECSEGFVSLNRELINTVQCLQSGWSSKPQCVEIKCFIPRGSLISTKWEYKNGDVAQVSCPSGSKISHSFRSQCYFYGWDPSLPTCEALICRVPNSYGRISPTKVEFGVNEVADFRCREYYILNGPQSVRCTENGWETAIPTCKEIECTITSTKHKTNTLKTTFRPGEETRVACKENSEYKNVECTQNGWSPALPTCQDTAVPTKSTEVPEIPETTVHPTAPDTALETDDQCPPPPNPKNAQKVDVRMKYVNGDTAEIKCKPGYKHHGSETITCQNGKWESAPQCIQLQPCENPPSIQNGVIIEEYLKETYFTDSVVKYKCDKGFELSGSHESVCLNGQWTLPPTCTGISCGKPPIVQFATIPKEKSSYRHGESIPYTCLQGYKISSENQAVCLNGVYWIVPTCNSSSCGTAPTIQNGRVISNKIKDYKSGEKALYQCDKNYAFEKKRNEAICQDSQWKQIPVCKRVGERCGPPPSVQDGDTLEQRKPDYASGESVHYRCPNMFVLQGNERVNCENGVWDDAPVCLEPCTAGEKEMKAHNIQFQWLPDNKLYSKHGDKMSFICISGYEISNQSLLRIQCIRGLLNYPTCIKAGSCVLSRDEMGKNSIFLNGTTVVESGKSVKFECNEGMSPENSLTATCNWKNIIYPKCVSEKKCDTVPNVPNGFLKSKKHDSYESGFSVEYDCNPDFEMTGSINVKCTNGQWSELPQCHGPCKISQEELDLRNIEIRSATDVLKTHRHSTEINVKCKTGFRHPNSQSLKAECSDRTLIYPRCFTGTMCRVNQETMDSNQLELDPIHQYENYYGEGDILQFRCKQGYHNDTELKGSCSKGNLTYPECKKKNACYIKEEELDKNNIEISESQKHVKYFESGAIIEFKCKSGFTATKINMNRKCSKGAVNYPACRLRRALSINRRT